MRPGPHLLWTDYQAKGQSQPSESAPISSNPEHPVQILGFISSGGCKQIGAHSEDGDKDGEKLAAMPLGEKLKEMRTFSLKKKEN